MYAQSSTTCINDNIDLREAKRACSANMEMAGWILRAHPFHCKPLPFFRFFILNENFVNFSEFSATWTQQSIASPLIERQNAKLLSHQWAWSRRWRWRGGVGFRIAVSKEPQRRYRLARSDKGVSLHQYHSRVERVCQAAAACKHFLVTSRKTIATRKTFGKTNN